MALENNKKKNDSVGNVFHREYCCPFYIFSLAVALILILFIPSEAKWIDTKKGWFLQPMLIPWVGLSVMAVFSFISLIPHLKCIVKTRLGFWLDYIIEALSESRVAIITSVLFFIYINSLNVIGFFLSTYLFVCTLLLLSRLFSRFWLIIALLTTLVIILIFRVAIGLWMEDVWLYEFLPDAWADFANRYL